MKPLKLVEERKSQLFKNLVLVSLLSIGISLLANFFSKKYESNNLILWIGLSLIVVVIIAYLVSFYKSKESIIKEESLFITDKEGRFVPIYRFGFSEDMESTLSSVFKENSVFEDKWINAFKAKKIVNIEDYEKNCIDKNKDIIGFVGELMEYVFLNRLSIIQSDYFDIDSNDVEVLTREKVSNYVLQNRVLEMISKPFEERSAFSDSHSTREDIGKTVYMVADGVVYERFELKLPKGTTLKKDKNNTLVIKNRNYSIYFKHGFSGFATVTPTSFCELYLNKNFRDVSEYKLNPELKIKLNPFFFLFSWNWKNMNWIDVICEEFSDYFSFDRFIEKIGYEYALTNITVAKNYSNFNNNKSKTPTEPDHIVKPQETTKEITVDGESVLDENEQKIIQMIANNTQIDKKQLAESIGAPEEQIDKLFANLLAKQIITLDFGENNKVLWKLNEERLK